MKKQALIFITLLISLFSINAAVCDLKWEIRMKGDLINLKARSLIEPLEVYADNENIYLNANNNLGALTITITSESNDVVFETVMNSEIERHLEISTCDFENGKYTIKITDSLNRSAEGEFEIN